MKSKTKQNKCDPTKEQSKIESEHSLTLYFDIPDADVWKYCQDTFCKKCTLKKTMHKNIEQPEKLPKANEVKAMLAPHMKALWDAALKCFDVPTDENLAKFKKLCRPADVMLLLRAYATSVIKGHLRGGV